MWRTSQATPAVASAPAAVTRARLSEPAGDAAAAALSALASGVDAGAPSTASDLVPSAKD